MVIDLNGNTINLAVRFILEIIGLIALGLWGWGIGDGLVKFVLGLGIPMIAAAIWGIFAVPDDPSRSGNAPVIVPGSARLALELVFFSAIVWVLFAMLQPMFGWLFGIIVIIHYLCSYERVLWLLGQ